jgi:hypothetical protein
VKYKLPRTPIKESERRAAKFEERYGEGATELDALEALHPGELRKIVEAEIDRYLELSEQIESVFDDIRADFNAEQPDLSQWEWPEPSEPNEDPDPLFDSRRGYVEQIDRYKQHQGKPIARRRRNGSAAP